jgi:hypothetical protein
VVTIANYNLSPIPTQTFFNPNIDTGGFPCFYSTEPDIIIDNVVNPNTIASGEIFGDPGESYLNFNQT